MYMQIYITCHQIQILVYCASEKYSDIEMPLRGLFEYDIHKDKYNNIEQNLLLCKHIEIQTIYLTANNFRNPYIILALLSLEISYLFAHI